MGGNSRNRREFLSDAGRTAAGLAIGAGLLTSSCARTSRVHHYEQQTSKPPVGPAEPIRLGFIGMGGRGRHLLGTFQKMEKTSVRAICDVNQLNLDQARKLAPENATSAIDYRQILERDDIDAVVIATPDHWHAIMTIEACQAGKDVYVEKPLSLCVEEGRRMVQAARKHGRIVQMGTQQRSGQYYKEARYIVQGGHLGKITMVRTWNFRNSMPGRGRPDNAPIPATLDWERWLGPRPKVPFNPGRLNFRFFWDYAGGILTDWGTHHFDAIHMIMNAKAPVSVSAGGGRFVIEDMTDVPDTLSVIYQYPDWTLEYSSRETNGRAPYGSEYGIEFCGTQGTMYLDRKGYMLFSEKDPTKPADVVGTPGVDNFVPPELDMVHVQNFLDCIRTRELPATDVEEGHLSTIVSHLGNIAYRTGRTLHWDAETETIEGDREANELLSRSYRKPYTLPQV